MLVLKKSVRERGYADSIGDDLKEAFEGRFRVEPEVMTSLGREWEKWERFASNDPGREYRNRITASDEGNFWWVRFCKSAFNGEPGYDRLKGTWTQEIAVYRDCIAPNGPIYKKRDVNR